MNHRTEGNLSLKAVSKGVTLLIQPRIAFTLLCSLLLGYLIVRHDARLDYYAHINVIPDIISGASDVSWAMLHYVLHLLKLTFRMPYPLGMSLTMGISIFASILITSAIFSKITDFSNAISLLISWILNIMTPLWIPFVFSFALNDDNIYIGAWANMPWQNPTYILMKPFALAVIYLFVQIIDTNKLNNGQLTKLSICMGIFLLVSVLAKPSFAFVFIPATVIYLLVKRRESSLRIILSVGAALALSLLAMGLQYLHTFDGHYYHSVLLSLGDGWGHFMRYSTLVQVIDNPIIANIIVISIAVFRAVLLPLIIHFFYSVNNSRFSSLIKYAWIFYGVSAAQLFFFAETNRIGGGNFAWGYCFALLVLYLVYLAIFADCAAGKDNLRRSSKFWIVTTLIVLQFAAGMLWLGTNITTIPFIVQ